MGLSRGGSGSGFTEFCADITNNLLKVAGVQYEPYKTANIMDEMNVYYSIPVSLSETVKHPNVIGSFVFFADTDYITREFYKPTSAIISNGAVVITSDKNYCVIIDFN